VDYSSTTEDLQKHFASCGVIHRVTILCDKFTGHPKGFAYIEFAGQESVQNALALNQSMLNNRQINVSSKLTEKRISRLLEIYPFN
jgi:polyadenylate-binding protein 2